MDKIVSSINEAGKTEQPHAKERKWTPMLDYIKKI